MAPLNQNAESRWDKLNHTDVTDESLSLNANDPDPTVEMNAEAQHETLSFTKTTGTRSLFANSANGTLSFKRQEEKQMGKLVWDQTGSKQYELGVDHGVLYKYDKTTQKWKGVAWNGLISVTESPDGAEETELWADNIKYGSLRSAEKFSGSIEAYTYPDEFEGCDGIAKPVKGMGISQQKREAFCLCYRTQIGNDLDSEAGYRLHLVYNATCSPSEKAYETINDSPDAITFSWDFDTNPINVKGYKPASHITFDSTDFVTEAEKAKLAALEDVLYGKDADAEAGTAATEAELPMPDDLIDLMD